MAGPHTFFEEVLLLFGESCYLCATNGISMFEFDQYLGFLAFLTIVTIGFWLMIFLLAFVVPYWLVGNLRELFKERREARRASEDS